MTPASALVSIAADLDTKHNLESLIMECTDQHRRMNTTLYKFQAEFLQLKRKAHRTGRP